MALEFVTVAAEQKDVTKLRLALSTFRDGTGLEREKDGTTRAHWRQMERVFAELLGAHPIEAKGIFDLVAADRNNKGINYGISVKSKCIPKIGMGDKEVRLYLELANSPALFWRPLKEQGINEQDFANQRQAERIGKSVLETVAIWHREGKSAYERINPGKKLDLDQSIYLVLSYGAENKGSERYYQVHTFPLELPNDIHWTFSSEKCLRGYTKERSPRHLFDWYGLSGGQLKYYPTSSDSKFYSAPFQLICPPQASITERAKSYWPQLWNEAIGEHEEAIKAEAVLPEIELPIAQILPRK